MNTLIPSMESAKNSGMARCASWSPIESLQASNLEERDAGLAWRGEVEVTDDNGRQAEDLDKQLEVDQQLDVGSFYPQARLEVNNHHREGDLGQGQQRD